MYPEDLIQNVYNTFLTNPSKTKRTSKSNSNNVRFIMGFNGDCRATSKIVKKHWHILCLNPKLGLHLPQVSKITFQKARTLKNLVAASKLKYPTVRRQRDSHLFFDQRVGIFQYRTRGCLTCQFNIHSVFLQEQ